MKDLEERLTRAFPELKVAPLEELATGFHSVAVETADGIVFRIPRQERTANGHTAEHRLLPLLAEPGRRSRALRNRAVTRWWGSARNELERFEPALRHGDP